MNDQQLPQSLIGPIPFSQNRDEGVVDWLVGNKWSFGQWGIWSETETQKQWQWCPGRLRREWAREYNLTEILITFSAKFLKFPRARLALCLPRGKLSVSTELLRHMLTDTKVLYFPLSATLAVQSGICPPSLCQRDLFSGEVSFKYPAKTGGNFLHEWLFTARSKAEQNLY